MTGLLQKPKWSRESIGLSAMLHIAGVIFLLQLSRTIVVPPVHRHSAAVVLALRPGRALPPPAKPRKRNLRAFATPPGRSPVAVKPPLLEAPALPAATAPAIRAFHTAESPSPAARIGTGVPDSPPVPATLPMPRAGTVKPSGFSQIIQNEPSKPPPSTTKAAGFDIARVTPNPLAPTPAVKSAGFDGAEATPNGTRDSTRATSAGAFGSATAAHASAGTAHTPQTATAGFGDATSTPAPAPTSAPSPPQSQDSTPVEITYQPRPAYTDEARRLQIEGEVQVEAVFTASGEVQIVRIARGLGHGLNESAIAAVRSIRFRPARQHGQPVASTATVRMRFELAY